MQVILVFVFGALTQRHDHHFVLAQEESVEVVPTRRKSEIQCSTGAVICETARALFQNATCY
jgi:hypothetical protein